MHDVAGRLKSLIQPYAKKLLSPFRPGKVRFDSKRADEPVLRPTRRDRERSQKVGLV